MRHFLFFIVTIIVLFAVGASGEIYQYVDQEGNVHFTDNLNQVPEDQRPQPVDLVARLVVEQER